MSYRIGDLSRATIHIGRVAENEYTRVQIDAGEIYAEYPHAAAALTVQPPAGEAYPAVVTRDGDLVVWDVPDSALAQEGDGEIQLTFEADGVVVKSAIGQIHVCRSLVGEGEAPDPLEDFLAAAGEALTAIPETIDAALEEAKESGEFDGPPGADGQDGADGYSPTATVTDITGGHRLTITDKNGTTTVDVMDGEDGQNGQDGADGYSPAAGVSKSGSTATITITDKNGTTTAQVSDGSDGSDGADGEDGYSPTVTITDITGGHRVTITDKDGDHTFDVMDGQGGGGTVTDVQVNGTSVVSSGVANVPIASNSAHGVVKTENNYGVMVNSTNGRIYVDSANTTVVKAGTDQFRPIVPYRQDTAVYYGLSKLAGEDLKNDTVTVGVYPEKSISAIHEMLNAPVSVSGSTPSITAKSGVRYICGEVATLTIVLPASGCVDVTFNSGATATVLTVTPPTGVTVKWANGFDPTSLDANTTYELNIMNGLGVAGAWT